MPLQHLDERGRRELALLVGIKNRRSAPYRDSLFQRRDAEGGVDSVRQLSRQDPATVEIYDCDQEYMTTLELDVGDIRRTDF